MLVKLNQNQKNELLKPNTGSGGFQSLMKTLQSKLDPASNELRLDKDLLEQILRYAYDYSDGGWQKRLENIFDL